MNTFLLSAVFAATATTGKMTLPTYMFSDGDPVPKTRSDYYPYYRFDGYEAKSPPRDWKTVTLESDRHSLNAPSGITAELIETAPSLEQPVNAY